MIANAGFSLVSEALHLGKPYLALPVRHQFEQLFNAYYVQKMGYGQYSEKLGPNNLADFLAEQALANRAVGENLVRVVIFLAGADEVEDLDVQAVEILDLDLGAEDDDPAATNTPPLRLNPGR